MVQTNFLQTETATSPRPHPPLPGQSCVQAHGTSTEGPAAGPSIAAAQMGARTGCLLHVKRVKSHHGLVRGQRRHLARSGNVQDLICTFFFPC